MNKFKISVITVTYNSELYLEQTIKSVIEQDYTNLEYIIIDGGSIDSTLVIINKYKEYIHYTLSEPDRNMYDAINKGLMIATGDYIAVLNSDDYYCNKKVISKVVEEIEKENNSSLGGIYGNLVKISDNNSILRKRRCFQVSYKELLLSKKLSFVGHATLFISKQCISEVGLYDSDNFYYAGDYDFILRCFYKFNFKYIDLDIFNFRQHNASITSSGKILIENELVLKKNGYYSFNFVSRSFYYYYVWTKFFVLNFNYLRNRLCGYYIS